MELDKLRKQALLLKRYENLKKSQERLNCRYDDFDNNDDPLIFVGGPSHGNSIMLTDIKGIVSILKKVVGEQLVEVRKEIDNL